jgi:DNA polymerase-3 subunit alpha
MSSQQWVPCHMHSSYSLLDGFSTSKNIVKRCNELGYKAAALTDHGSISGCVEFHKECNKGNIKPILGCELYVCKNNVLQKDNENRGLDHLVVLCKNKNGWDSLVQCISESNKSENFYFKPRVDHNLLKRYLSKDIIAITGHPGTELSNSLFPDNLCYRAKTVEEARKNLYPDWKDRALSVINDHIDIFGENLFIEIQLIDNANLPVSVVIAECLREIVTESKGKLNPVGTADSHYVYKTDAEYQRILLCSALGRTMPSIQKDLSNGKDVPLGTFFISNNYHIPSVEELIPLHTKEELDNAVRIAGMCEEYDILGPPQLPKFDCPEGKEEYEYLTDLCRKGWKELLVGRGVVTEDNIKTIYLERIKKELAIIKDANLSGYFLIVQDIINYCRSRGWMVGPGRGSAAGCLISYLIGITSIDPIPYDLIFERFYSAARAGSLPDIDLDVPSEYRDEVIAYIKQKYGEENVSQMVTFNALMGRSALKEVLKIEGVTGFSEMNEITEHVPNEAEIIDDLQETNETSIIRWALKNRASKLERWCTIDDEGNLNGEYAEVFRKAIAIEGTKKSQGKHAAGVIISAYPLASVCPMVRDKQGTPIAGFEMGDLESLGHVKFDILGIDLLSKLMKITEFDKSLDINNLEDEKTWDMLCQGDVKGVFQLERQKRWTKELKPQNIHHLSALIAIIRPGVADAMLEGKSMTKHYVDRKNALEETTYLFDCLEPILNKNYGILIYQEEALRIAAEIAQFNLLEADALRKAIGKKLVDKMAALKEKFIDGCTKANILGQADATTLFEWIEKSQKYLFNASHSYSYAINAYQSAYCKANNPGKFYEVYLDHAKRKQDTLDEIRLLVNDAKLHDIEVLPPNLENFHRNFLLVGTDKIFFGISNIKDVGETECEKIFDIANELDLKNLTWMEILAFMADRINKRALTALISTGALNGPNNKVSRARMLYEYESWKNLTKKEKSHIISRLVPTENLAHHIKDLINTCKIAKNRLVNVSSIYKSVEQPLYSMHDDESKISELENKYLGISLSCSKVDSIISHSANATCKDVYTNSVRGICTLLVEIKSFREIKIKNGQNKGEPMAFLSVEDSSATLDSAVLFSEAYKQFKSLLFEGNTVMLTGKTSDKKDGSFIVDTVVMV